MHALCRSRQLDESVDRGAESLRRRLNQSARNPGDAPSGHCFVATHSVRRSQLCAAGARYEGRQRMAVNLAEPRSVRGTDRLRARGRACGATSLKSLRRSDLGDSVVFDCLFQVAPGILNPVHDFLARVANLFVRAGIKRVTDPIRPVRARLSFTTRQGEQCGEGDSVAWQFHGSTVFDLGTGFACHCRRV